MASLKKSILSAVFLPIVMVIAVFVPFFFWASSANWVEDSYTQVKQLKPVNEQMAARSDTFSVMTYNIGYLSGMLNNTTETLSLPFVKANLEQVSTHLRIMNLDYVALQEVDFYASRTHYIDQLFTLGEAAGFPNLAYAVNWDKRYLPFPYSLTAHFGQLVSGQAILSASPIITNKRLVLQKVESQPAYYQAFYLDRLVQIMTTKRGAKQLAIMNVHLDHSDESTRAKQATTVLKLFEELNAKFDAVILLGDFKQLSVFPQTSVSQL